MLKEEQTLDKALAYLRNIAEQYDCPACNYEKRKAGTGISICSKHRDAVLLANGFLNGWTQRGGMPVNFIEEEDD